MSIKQASGGIISDGENAVCFFTKAVDFHDDPHYLEAALLPINLYRTGDFNFLRTIGETMVLE
ncbi:hypothetical protein [Lentibacillus salicampi]|uniref:Uncharacterized protein n=1 Tax=Lentibacillus salicampi TaxID=175306 RepID=A0A4Y9AAZ8_9BACI|nr:hypothetical protein [Lentibacillus salicampi]TFJ92973.1 hypothetical protein E4U82_09090 [Lentibacillus salicampi]